MADCFGGTLFDADRDFNVGGVSIGSQFKNFDLRLASSRLIEGVGGSLEQTSKDGKLFSSTKRRRGNRKRCYR